MVSDRRCRDCKVVKPREAFGPDPYRQDGLCGYCLDCAAALDRQGEKTCSSCKASKPRSHFWRQKSSKDGLDPQCTPCGRARRAASRKRKPVTTEQRRTYVATYKAKHPERVASYDRRRMLARFGLTEADYEAMLEAQGGRCAICRREEIAAQAIARLGAGKKVRGLAVDHCHRTGRTRALLCQRCNTAIGLLDDSPGLLEAAIAYLLAHAAESGVSV